MLTTAASPLQEIQQSHIDGNLPATFEAFNKILERDLTKYFSGILNSDINIKYELLRRRPTQSGLAYPKFYAWVTILSSGKVVEAGAVRVAAIDKTRIDVTNFISQRDIVKHPKSIDTVFPAALCDDIRFRARKPWTTIH